MQGAGQALPFTNVAFARDLAKGTRTVFSHGGAMNGIKGSEFYKSIGHEPGTGGGVKSGVNLHRRPGFPGRPTSSWKAAPTPASPTTCSSTRATPSRPAGILQERSQELARQPLNGGYAPISVVPIVKSVT
ncbi:PAAR-like domain-containing protein [Afifella aestuarii]|uniref:PAAR-like domain-containing protein n=1 Tax=Afifella aestuarii TaxID=1909496 RepID=UPI0013E3A22A